MAKKNQKKFRSFETPELGNACQTLLANIRFASVDDDVKAIVVTSTAPDEGKTTVSANLALAIASSGKRVLLVDADMRRRCLGNLLGVHPAHGLYALLSGRATAAQAIVKTGYDNLAFLDCEPNIPSPPNILSAKRFADLVGALRAEFDYVIFDTPPVGVFIDAAIIGSVADGTLLVVRERKTKRNEIANSIQQLKTANARILGAVVTFSRAQEENYRYNYYGDGASQKGRGGTGGNGAHALNQPSTTRASAVAHLPEL